MADIDGSSGKVNIILMYNYRCKLYSPRTENREPRNIRERIDLIVFKSSSYTTRLSISGRFGMDKKKSLLFKREVENHSSSNPTKLGKHKTKTSNSTKLVMFLYDVNSIYRNRRPS